MTYRQHVRLKLKLRPSLSHLDLTALSQQYQS